MRLPVTHEVFQEPVYQAFKPSISGIDQGEQETCIHLPFALVFENLTYLGTVSRESWHVSPHYHDHFELCYVDEGEGWFVVNDFSYPVRKGDLFLTKPWEVHAGTARGASPYRLYYLGFELDQMSNLEADYYQFGVHRVCPDQQESIHGIFTEMFTELQGQQAHALEMIQSLFLRLLVSVLRIYGQSEQAQPDKSALLSPVIRAVLDAIHGSDGPGASYTLDALARQVHLSRSHLAREFKRCLGVSPGEYIRTMRLEWSKHYLRETDTSISQIAALLHFPSIHTFSVFFKRHTGLAPQEYRKQALSRLLALKVRTGANEPDS